LIVDDKLFVVFELLVDQHLHHAHAEVGLLPYRVEHEALSSIKLVYYFDLLSIVAALRERLLVDLSHGAASENSDCLCLEAAEHDEGKRDLESVPTLFLRQLDVLHRGLMVGIRFRVHAYLDH